MDLVYCKPYDIRYDDVLPNGRQHVNIRFWCQDPNSNPVLVRVEDFYTFIRIQLPTVVEGKLWDWNEENVGKFKDWLEFVLGKDKPISCVKRNYKELYYVQDESPFLVCAFSSLEAQNHCVNLLRKERVIKSLEGKNFQFKCCESDVDPIRKLLTLKKQQYTQWFSFPREKVRSFATDEEARISKPGNSQRPLQEYLISHRDMTPVDNEISKEWLVKPRLLGYDFETYSDNHKAFPDSYNPAHPIYNISCIGLDDKDDNTKVRFSLLYGKAPAPDDAIHIETSSEMELLDKFEKVIDDYDPDILTGYNIFGFDNEYYFNRKRVADEDIGNFTRLKKGVVKIDIKKWKSSGFGYNIMYIIDAEGRLNIDMLPIIKRDYKFSMYTLNFVSKEMIGEQKHDVSAQQMFQAYEANQLFIRNMEWLKDNYAQYKDNPKKLEELFANLPTKKKVYNVKKLKAVLEGTDTQEEFFEKLLSSDLRFIRDYQKMKSVLEYCLQDSELVIKIFNKTNQWISLNEMSYVVGVTIMQLFTRGQQVRTYSMIFNLAWYRGFVITRREGFPIIEYSGAFVITPIVGLHNNVLCEDFAALYPSIMIAHNVDFTTLVNPQQTAIILEENDPKVLAKYHHIRIFLEKGLKNQEMIENDLAEVENVRKELDDDEEEDSDAEEEDLDQALNLKALDQDDEPLDPKKEYTEYNFLWLRGEHREGLMPEMMRTLVSERNQVKADLAEVKKELKIAKDPTRINYLCMQEIILDKRQLAIKVSANSGYGFLGAQMTGMLPLIEGAMSVTHLGKRFIRRCIRYLIETYGAIIIYGDTDSVMFIIPGVEGGACDAVGKRIAAELSALFPPPLKLEFEKAMKMISLKKKKYAAYLIKKDGSYVTEDDMKKNGSLIPYILVRGIVIARRDNCSLLRDGYTDLLRTILEDKDICQGYEVLVKYVLKLLYQEIDPVKELSVVKTLNAQYKSGSAQMKVFGDKLARIGKPAKPGERLSYLILKDDKDGTSEALKLGDKMILSEDYDPDQDEIDMVYYLERLLKNPIDQLFQVGYMTEIPKYEGFHYLPKYSRKRSKSISNPIEMISLMLQDANRSEDKVSFKKMRSRIKRLPNKFRDFVAAECA